MLITIPALPKLSFPHRKAGRLQPCQVRQVQTRLLLGEQDHDDEDDGEDEDDGDQCSFQCCAVASSEGEIYHYCSQSEK